MDTGINMPVDRRCEACGVQLERKTGEKPVHWKRRRYCGLTCGRTHGRNRQPLSERFFSKVEVTPDCHEWQGAKGRDGYGSIALGDGTTGLAHRVAYALAFGEIGNGAQVLHRCDNPGCVNPAHLFLGDHADNMADMASKQRGRSAIGAAHHAAKLNAPKVRAIRADTREQREIAADYGVSHATVGAIQRRETWKHVA
jgi:hypothetical protein